MTSEHFHHQVDGLAPAWQPRTIQVDPGGEFDLHIAPVAKQIGQHLVRMLAYNGSVPGPTLYVQQHSEITVNVVNDGDLEATVHWHGLRLDNQHDGTHETQSPMPIGGKHTYKLTFPDPGVYWYHPHIREDYAQEMGLYGNIVVVPADSDYWPDAHREIAITLDDIFIEDGRIAPFSRTETTFVAMGRFGNVMLVNGETDLKLTFRPNEVVRLFLTNTANTRVFNVALPGARMKLVGGDSGRCEREGFVESVILAPSERVVVDVQFEAAGEFALKHRTPTGTHTLATVAVAGEAASALAHGDLRTNADMVAERARLTDKFDAAPDKTIALVAWMDMGTPDAPAGSTIVYYCPMHPDVVSETEDRCPRCTMKLVAKAVAPSGYACPMHPEIKSDEPGRCPKCNMKLVAASLVKKTESVHGEAHHHGDAAHSHDIAGIEWEDDMVDVNRLTTPANTRWKIIDRNTGFEGHKIDWRFRVGDRVKIRVVNETDSDHPMHHPFHIHGAGRFLVMARDGVAESNLVWKDTVLIPTGQVVDLLLEVTNPGRWMAHCHIAEHHESGMMFSFTVDP